MYHAPTGLHWMRARWYAPQWGRFLTPEARERPRFEYLEVNSRLDDPFPRSGLGA